MNLLEQLSKELDKLHLNEFEKVRYIYLRCCEIFSFDSRWFYADVYGEENTLRPKLLNRVFDIENINPEDEVLCYTFSSYILKPLIDNLTNLECEVVTHGTHSFVELNYNGIVWNLDATLGDLPRVKLDIPTKGFTSCDSIKDLIIDDIDLELGFCNKSEDDYRNFAIGENYTETVQKIGKVLAESKVKYHYGDAMFLFEDVMNGCNYSEDNKTYLDRQYNFHRLIDIPGEYSFFEIAKREGEYSIKKIRPIEYKVLTKYLRGK